METMQKHNQTKPINNTRKTSSTLWNISFHIQDTSYNNAANKNNCEKIKGYNSVSLKSFIDLHFDCFAISCVSSLKVMVLNTVLEVPKFEISHVDYFTTQIYKNLFKIFISTLGEKNQVQSAIDPAVY